MGTKNAAMDLRLRTAFRFEHCKYKCYSHIGKIYLKYSFPYFQESITFAESNKTQNYGMVSII